MKAPVTALAALALVALGAPAPAGANSLTLASYNLTGIPDATFEARQAEIITKLNELGAGNPDAIVHLQEVFVQSHFDQLTDPVDGLDYMNITPASGSFVQLGTGLVTASDRAFTSLDTVDFDDCAKATDPDCTLINKGFTVARYELEPSVFVDVYNTHTDAGGGSDDTESPIARQANLAQIAAYMDANSSDVPVILLGDTNSRHTAIEDGWAGFLSAAGLKEVWIELPRMGDIPGFGPSLKDGCVAPEGDAVPGSGTSSGPDCEILDKVVWRDGGDIVLEPTEYEVLENFFDGAGDPLSDHLPVITTFAYTVIPEPASAALLALGLAGLCIARRRRS